MWYLFLWWRYCLALFINVLNRHRVLPWRAKSKKSIESLLNRVLKGKRKLRLRLSCLSLHMPFCLSVKWRDTERSLDFLFCGGYVGERVKEWQEPAVESWSQQLPQFLPSLLHITHAHIQANSHPQVSCNSHEMLQKYSPPPRPEEDIHSSLGR